MWPACQCKPLPLADGSSHMHSTCKSLAAVRRNASALAKHAPKHMLHSSRARAGPATRAPPWQVRQRGGAGRGAALPAQVGFPAVRGHLLDQDQPGPRHPERLGHAGRPQRGAAAHQGGSGWAGGCCCCWHWGARACAHACALLVWGVGGALPSHPPKTTICSLCCHSEHSYLFTKTTNYPRPRSTA